MKKTTKLLALILTIACIAATFTLYSSAAYNSSLSRSGWVKTIVTGTDISHTFYISTIKGGTFLFDTFVRGGNKANFLTELELFLSNGAGYRQPAFPGKFDSDTLGTNVLEQSILGDSSVFENTGYGSCYADYTCTSKTNSNDYWRQLYACKWNTATGWVMN